MAHEKSTTIGPVTIRGKRVFVNLKTVIAGKSVGSRGAAKLFRSGDLKPLGGRTFPTMKAAVGAAKARSNARKK